MPVNTLIASTFYAGETSRCPHITQSLLNRMPERRTCSTVARGFTACAGGSDHWFVLRRGSDGASRGGADLMHALRHADVRPGAVVGVMSS